MNARARALLLLAAALGCAHEAPWIEPSDRWQTVSTPHFVIHTDAWPRQYEPVAQQLETTHAALAETFFHGVEIPKVEALLFSDPAEMEEILGRGVGGVFVAGVGRGGVLALACSEWTRVPNETAAHELTHRFARSAYPHLPRWLHEGLATYFGSLHVRETAVRFGAAPIGSSLDYEVGGGTVPLADLIGSSRQQMYGPAAPLYYTTAWALVHYLINGERGARYRRFPAFLAAVDHAGGTPSATFAALEAIYPEQTLPELDVVVTQNATRRARIGVEELLVMPFAAPPPPAMITQPADRPMVRDLCRTLKNRRRARR